MKETELKEKLANICTEHQVDRFAVDEIWEMVTEGEDLEWLVGMLTEGKPEAVAPVAEILTAIHQELGQPAPEPPATILEPAAIAEPGIDEVEKPVAEEPLNLAKVIATGGLEGLPLPQGFSTKKLEKLLASPQGLAMTDFAMFCQEKGIDPTLMATNSDAVAPYMAEWMELPREAFGGKTPREMIAENPEMAMPAKAETFRREQPKVGRNDPCPCGSGKKYKKCCGKGE